LHQCIRSLVGAVLLRTIMDISARATSLTDRPQRAIRVTSVRMRREDRTSISSHPLADLGWKLLIGLHRRLLLISRSSFVRAKGRSFVPARRTWIGQGQRRACRLRRQPVLRSLAAVRLPDIGGGQRRVNFQDDGCISTQVGRHAKGLCPRCGAVQGSCGRGVAVRRLALLLLIA
jgi:hypothetical protein